MGKANTRNIMEDFLTKFQSFAGLIAILHEYNVDGILSVAEEMFERPKGELAGLEIETVGSMHKRVAYSKALSCTIKGAEFLGKLYDSFKDEASRIALYSIVKYWLLPDPSFLQEAIDACGDGGEKNATKVLGSPEKINNEIDSIRNLQSGEEISINIGSAVEELWVTYGLLAMLREDLNFQLRVNNIDDVVLYAGISLPKMQALVSHNRSLRVASIAKDPREWHNAELLKDKGTVPYLLHKKYGYDSVMVGVNNGDYPYLVDYLPGMRMEFLPDGSQEAKNQWIAENAKDIDILIVNGVYTVNQEISRIYKELNPDGLTYMPLDANSIWMETMDHRNEGFSKLLGRMDVIATSGRKMQRYLNKKWPWPIEYFQNGYFAPWTAVKGYDYADKENTILTVSRVGSPEKANDIMMLAFTRIADQIPGWNLKLVGGIDPSFERFREDYYQEYPEMKDRVIFTGAITDKAALYEEYRRAKVFTITSRTEGGTPNVVGEALHGGCAVAITEIDACQDAIAFGKCGMTAAIDDIEGIADMYLRMCSDEDKLQEMCDSAYEYSESYFCMERVVERIHESLEEVV